MPATPVTGNDLVVSALMELGVVGIGETPEGSLADFVLQKANRLIDTWNAKRQAVWAVDFLTFTLTAGLQPIRIGPTGDFVVAQRPVSIDAANIILTNTSPNTRVPVYVHSDPAWWMSVSTPSTTSDLPSDLFYNPSMVATTGDPENGDIYLWAKQSFPYDIELMVRVVLAEIAYTTNITMPQGYWDALVLTLAEDCATPLKRVASPLMRQKAKDARAQIFANNTIVPSITTADAGMPTRAMGSKRSNWNWLNGCLGNAQSGWRF